MRRRVRRRLRTRLSLFCFFVCPVNNADRNSEYQRNNKCNDKSGDIADQNKHNKNNDDQSAKQRINLPKALALSRQDLLTDSKIGAIVTSPVMRE